MRPLHARSQGSTNIRSCWFFSALGLNAGTVVKKERANPRTASHVFLITEHMPHAFAVAFELSGTSITFIDAPRLA